MTTAWSAKVTCLTIFQSCGGFDDKWPRIITQQTDRKERIYGLIQLPESTMSPCCPHDCSIGKEKRVFQLTLVGWTVTKPSQTSAVRHMHWSFGSKAAVNPIFGVTSLTTSSSCRFNSRLETEQTSLIYQKNIQAPWDPRNVATRTSTDVLRISISSMRNSMAFSSNVNQH